MNVREGRARPRREFSPAAGRTYVSSDMRAAVRRAGAWLAAREATGLEPPFVETYAADLLRRGRSAGLLGCGERSAVVRFSITPEWVESSMRLTAARSLRELILIALVSTVLKRRGFGPRFADRRPPRTPKRRRPAPRRHPRPHGSGSP